MQFIGRITDTGSLVEHCQPAPSQEDTNFSFCSKQAQTLTNSKILVTKTLQMKKMCFMSLMMLQSLCHLPDQISSK